MEEREEGVGGSFLKIKTISMFIFALFSIVKMLAFF